MKLVDYERYLKIPKDTWSNSSNNLHLLGYNFKYTYQDRYAYLILKYTSILDLSFQDAAKLIDCTWEDFLKVIQGSSNNKHQYKYICGRLRAYVKIAAKNDSSLIYLEGVNKVFYKKESLQRAIDELIKNGLVE